MRSRLVVLGTALAAAAACAPSDASHDSAARHLVTAVPFAEDIHVGSSVVINHETVGEVRRIVHLACDTGVALVLAITRPDAPLLQGTIAQIQPTFGGEQVALLLPPPGDTLVLAESANVPGLSRAATAAERHHALRLVLPAIGLAAFTPFIPRDSSTSSAARHECAPRKH